MTIHPAVKVGLQPVDELVHSIESIIRKGIV